MPNLTQLLANRRATAVDLSTLGAEDIQIEYYLAHVTTETLIIASDYDNLANLTPERQQTVLASLPDTLLPLLASWNLTETDPADGSETPLPLDRAHIDALGIIIQMIILRTILSAKGEASALGASASAPASSANS